MHCSHKTVDKSVISGPCWSVVSGVGHHSPSVTCAADAINSWWCQWWLSQTLHSLRWN